MEITRGKIQKAKKVVVYGPEGIGKSTFAARFPDAVFIDTEGSTNGMDVARAPKPTSWEMLIGEVKEIAHEKLGKTIVVDTIDWAEQLCLGSILARYDKKGIEDFGYGNGYVYEKEEFGRFLNLLQDVVDGGINVVLTAHAQIKKFEQPDELGAYDRWELKLGKKTGSQISPLVKEWADMVLFANYRTYAVASDDSGKKFKGQGGERVMYTTHNPCWDAKNRDGLPEKLPFEFGQIAHLFSLQPTVQPVHTKESVANIEFGTTEQQQEKAAKEMEQVLDHLAESKPPIQNIEPVIPDGIPKELADLMRMNDVSESDIRRVVGQRGYYPENTPIQNYDENFVRGCLIGAWEQMLPMIRANQDLPF